MLTDGSLSVIYNEVDGAERVIMIFSGLIQCHPIGGVIIDWFGYDLKFLVDLGCRDVWICNTAANTGSLECLEYAHTHGCPWDKGTCKYAARGGYLKCLKYAHEHGCPWDHWTCIYAGSLKCLEYAHAHGCPWDELTTSHAAREGSLECLIYAHEHGCPWDKWTCFWVSSRICLEYLKANGCPQ